MDKYVFFIDIDETLITGGSYFPESNIAAINKVRQNGHKVFINTGRSLAHIPGFVFEKAEFDGIIAGSGCYISIGSNVLLRDFIRTEQIEKNCRFLLNVKRQCLLEGEDRVLYINRTPNRPGVEEVKYAEEIIEKYPDIKVEKVNLPGVLSPAEKMYFRSQYKVIQHKTYAECWLRGYEKGLALKKVMRFYKEYKSVAIGDSLNDFDMMEKADISVAMGNGTEEIKRYCDFIAGNASEGGLGDFMLTLTNLKGQNK